MPSSNSDVANKKYVDDLVGTDIATLKSYLGMLNLTNFNKPSTANYVFIYDGTNLVWKLLNGSNITAGSILTSCLVLGSGLFFIRVKTGVAP